MLGLSFKLYNRFCFPWIWLFYLLEEISMSKNLSNSSDIIEILIACLFLGLSEVLCLNLPVTKDCLSFLKCHISWSFLQYSSNFIFYILGCVVLGRFKLQTFRQQWYFKGKGISSWDIYYIFTYKFTFYFCSLMWSYIALYQNIVFFFSIWEVLCTSEFVVLFVFCSWYSLMNRVLLASLRSIFHPLVPF